MKQNQKYSNSRFLIAREKRRRPKWKYILLWGVIYWAVPVFIITSIFSILIGDRNLSDILRMWFVELLTWLIAGTIFGYCMWYYYDKRYKKLKAELVMDSEQVQNDNS